MASESDIRYLDAAVDAALMSRASADEVVELLAKYDEMSMTASAREVAVKKGYLTEEQAKSLARQMTARIRITGYDIIEKAGTGGMGTVWRARQTALDRDVAIKILPPSTARDPGFVAHFMKEARAVAKLNHENIVQGIDVGESNGYYYFAMEFVDGPTVKELVEAGGPLPEGKALEITEGVARALMHAEAAGIVHRDVKPANIILTSAGVPKLADLGLAGRSEDASPASEPGIAVGTPHYMSPEQAEGRSEIDHRSDVYSLGATLFYMLTGSPPFEGGSAAEVMTKHVEEDLDPVRSLRPDISPAASKMVAWMMEKLAEDRPPSAGELAEEIERIRSGRPPSVRLRGERRRSVRAPSVGPAGGLVIAIVAGVAVAVGAMVVWGGGGGGRSVPEPGDEPGEPPPGIVTPPRAPAPAAPGVDLDSMTEAEIASFLEKNPGHDFADAARTRLARLAEERRLAETQEKALAGKTAAGSFSEAMELVAAGETGRLSRADARGRVETAALAALKPLRDEAKRASRLSPQRIGELVLRLGKLDLGRLGALEKMRGKAVASLHGELAARERRAEAAYAEFSGKFLEKLSAGDLDAAGRVARDVLSESALSGAHGRVRRDLARLAWLGQVEAAAAEGVKSLAGKRHSFEQRGGGRITGEVSGISAGRVTVAIRARGGMRAETSFPFEKLSAREVASLARLAGGDDVEMRRKICFALIAAGCADEARAELAWLASRGAKPEGLDAFLAIIRRGAAEHAAAALWPGIEREIAAGRWAEAKRLAEEFTKRYGSTEFARSKAGTFARVAAKAAELTAKGRPQASADGLLLYAAFDDKTADAVFAKGQKKATLGKCSFTADGRLNGAVRIRSGGSVTYRRKKNMKLGAGTAMLWAKGTAPKKLWNDRSTHALFICGGGNNRFPMWASVGRLRIESKDASGEMAGLSGGQGVIDRWDDSKWHHAAMCWRSRKGRGVMVLYADGAEIARDGDRSMPSEFHKEIVLGLYGGSQFPFDGWMDELYVHDRVLEPEEIAAAAAVRPAPERRWRRIFNLLDGGGLNLDNSWKVAGGTIVREGGGAMQSSKDFAEGEIEIRFRIEAGKRAYFGVRQGAGGLYRVSVDEGRSRKLAGKWHTLRFAMAGDRVTATLDGKPEQVSPRGKPKTGRIQIGGSNSGITLREIRYRPPAK